MPRVSENPNSTYSRPIIIDGNEYQRAVGSGQTSEQDVPSKPIQSGAEVGQRNVALPETGSIQISSRSGDVGALRDLAREEDPITITTAEGSVSNVVVDSVGRDNDVQYDDKFDVTLEWKQIEIADVGDGSIVANTGDGQATGSSESQVASETSGGDSRETSDGPETSSEGGGFLSEAMSPVDSIADDIGDFF
ncbi:phage baseplate protein [Saliphagus sp. LR7]|uniref:phage baseplate protein n=1 Tax=Saliphagus sp. LR7 TaxID=2282654 RepID=UPI000DF7507F|nr:hypothetical protein [Saliphagus sp. LR7]